MVFRLPGLRLESDGRSGQSTPGGLAGQGFRLRKNRNRGAPGQRLRASLEDWPPAVDLGIVKDHPQAPREQSVREARHPPAREQATHFSFERCHQNQRLEEAGGVVNGQDRGARIRHGLGVEQPDGAEEQGQPQADQPAQKPVDARSGWGALGVARSGMPVHNSFSVRSFSIKSQ